MKTRNRSANTMLVSEQIVVGCPSTTSKDGGNATYNDNQRPSPTKRRKTEPIVVIDDGSPPPEILPYQPQWYCSEGSLSSLDTGSPINDQVLNGILRLMQPLCEGRFEMVDSLAADRLRASSGEILAPVHLRPSEDPKQHHWVLAMIPESRAFLRILDSLPGDTASISLAKEKVRESWRLWFGQGAEAPAINWASPLPQEGVMVSLRFLLRR